jgi:hypothetical protein
MTSREWHEGKDVMSYFKILRATEENNKNLSYDSQLPGKESNQDPSR